MAAGNVARTIRAPGRLVVNPTEAFHGGTFPYGGTEVGRSNLCVVQPLGTMFRVEYESLGEAGDILEANNNYVFACFLRGWDDEAIELLFSGNYERGTITQHAVLHEPGRSDDLASSVPGASTLPRAMVLAYVPDDIVHVPGVLIYRGIPGWTEGAELVFQRGSELGLPLTVECLRTDIDNNILRIGRMADLMLA